VVCRLQQQTTDSAKRPRNFGSQSQAAVLVTSNELAGRNFGESPTPLSPKSRVETNCRPHLPERNTEEHSINLYQTQNYPPRATTMAPAATVLTILQERSTSPA